MRWAQVILSIGLIVPSVLLSQTFPGGIQDLVDDGATAAEIESDLPQNRTTHPRVDWAQRWRWLNDRWNWRGRLEAGWLQLLGNRNGDGAGRWSVTASRSGWRMIGGGWRLASPAGWIAAGAGRWRTPNATVSSVSQAIALGSDTSIWRVAPVTGVTLGKKTNHWRCLWAQGREMDRSGSHQLTAGMVSGRWGRSMASVLVVRRASGLGVSSSGRLSAADGHVAWDAATVDPLNQPTAALHIGSGWQPRGGQWRIDADTAWAGGGFRTAGGGRNGLIPGDVGRGWSLRCAWRRRGHWKIGTLLAGGMALELQRGPGETDHRDIMGLRVERVLSDTSRLRARYRVTRTWREGWGERPVWEGPGVSQTRRDQIVSLGASGKWEQSNIHADLRGRELQKDGRRQRRARLLLGWDVDTLKGGSLSVRWTRAWGDDLDLVTVVSPVRGEVVIQHWGKAEQGMSLGWRSALAGGEIAISGWYRADSSGLDSRRELLLVWSGQGGWF